MSDLGLNENHEEEIKKFLKFARYNRNQQMKEVEGSFQDLKDSRLHEDTFTVDEVEEMIDGLQAVVKGAVEMELLNATHTNVLLLVQLFSQAEKWHLKLQADISELENQKLLKDIADFEEQEVSGRRNKNLDLSSLAQKSKLQPLNEGGSAALLQMEISRLKEENDVLKKKISTLEKSTSSTLSEKSKLKSDLEKAQRDASNRPSSTKADNSDDMNMLSNRISSLSADLRESEANYNRKFSSMDEELANAKHYILNLQHELETLHGEFDKKFSETTQFKNLKKMLEGKNTQIKELRSRVKKYEPDCEL